MAPPAARIGDMHTCPMVNPGPVPHVGGPILPPCAVTVITGGRPQARVGDMAVCVGPTDVIAKGSATVIVSGMPAARLGDSTAHGGVIVVGFPTVIIGDAGGGGGGKRAAGAGLEGGGSFVQPAIQAKALIAAAKDGTPFCERCNASLAQAPKAAKKAPAARTSQPAVTKSAPARPASQTNAAPPVTPDQMRKIMPNAGARADTYVDPLNSAMRANGITTREQQAAFLAQIAQESGDLANTTENLNYSAPRLTEVWPKRFPTLESATPYARNPEALANRVYASRLGNGDAASGDGYRYRGRGLMQVTGRDNYRAIGFEDNPEALSEPVTAADTAARWWSSNNLPSRTNGELSRADFDAVSRTVNGGDHGINERWRAYQRGLSALGTGG